MNELSGLIKCKVCSKNYNFKLNANIPTYICQTRKNKSSKVCNSPILREQYLLDIIQSHLKHQNKDTTKSIRLFVKEINVYNDRIKILYKDGTFSEMSGSFLKI